MRAKMLSRGIGGEAGAPNGRGARPPGCRLAQEIRKNPHPGEALRRGRMDHRERRAGQGAVGQDDLQLALHERPRRHEVQGLRDAGAVRRRQHDRLHLVDRDAEFELRGRRDPVREEPGPRFPVSAVMDPTSACWARSATDWGRPLRAR